MINNNKYSKEITKSREDTRIYVKTPCGEESRAATNTELHYGDEEYKVEANKDEEVPNPQQPFTNLGEFGESNASPLTLTLKL